jgi:hypothetical protein
MAGLCEGSASRRGRPGFLLCLLERDFGSELAIFVFLSRSISLNRNEIEPMGGGGSSTFDWTRRVPGFSHIHPDTYRRVQRAVVRVLHRVQVLQALQQRLEPFVWNAEFPDQPFLLENRERDVPQGNPPTLRELEHVVLPVRGVWAAIGRHANRSTRRNRPEHTDRAPTVCRWSGRVGRGVSHVD